MARSRTVHWQDPGITAAMALRTKGLDLLDGITAGRLPAPPIAELLGMKPLSVQPGRATFALEIGEHLYNPIGTVHGGVHCTLLDTVMGCAVHSLLQAGQAYTTLELKVNMVRRLTVADGRVIAEGEIVSLGSRVATAQGRIVGPDGKLFAHGTTTCLLLGAEDTGAKPPAD